MLIWEALALSMAWSSTLSCPDLGPSGLPRLLQQCSQVTAFATFISPALLPAVYNQAVKDPTAGQMAVGTPGRGGYAGHQDPLPHILPSSVQLSQPPCPYSRSFSLAEPCWS